MTPSHDFSPFAPLPGTEPPTRGVFVDRWGTLLALPPAGSCSRFAEAGFVEGAVNALFRAQQAGWRVYLIGNEPEVAMGRTARSTWERFEQELLEHLAGQGVHICRNYACLDDPEGQGPHRKPSVFRLPDTGLLYHAAQLDGVDLERSWVVGDGRAELAAGGRAGCGTIGVLTGCATVTEGPEVDPTLTLDSLVEAIEFLLGVPVETR